MAKVTLKTYDVKNVLVDVLQKAADAVKWLPDKPEVTLEIPAPYDHALDRGVPEVGHPCLAVLRTGPEVRAHCFALDECGEFGILLGVMQTMPKKKKEKKGSEAQRTAGRRR